MSHENGNTQTNNPEDPLMKSTTKINKKNSILITSITIVKNIFSKKQELVTLTIQILHKFHSQLDQHI
jgi:hypothetical protein